MDKARDAVDAAIVQQATCTPLELWRSMSPTAGTDAPADEATLSKIDMAHERATLLLSFVTKKHTNKLVAQARQVRSWPAHCLVSHRLTVTASLRADQQAVIRLLCVPSLTLRLDNAKICIPTSTFML